MNYAREVAEHRRGGRRPGNTQTRAAILAAARDCFAEHGYAETTIRRIATDAQVDPALVMHFFGSKDGLFAETLRNDPPIGDLPGKVMQAPTAELGTRLVEHYLRRWEDPRTGPWISAVTRAASASPSASAALAAFMTDAVMLPLARRAGGDNAELRANLAGAHILGVGMARYVLRVEPLATQDPRTVVGIVGPIIQLYLTGPLALSRCGKGE
ncbi:MAG: TetR family transcriptional regulator [Mycobacterium sp.]